MNAPFRFTPRVERLPARLSGLSPGECLARLCDRERPVLFDSSAGTPRRFSLLAFDPLPAPVPADLEELRALLATLEPLGGDGLPFPTAFAGGVLGALAYDHGVAGEVLELPRDPWRLPTLTGGLYVDYLVHDHDADELWLVLGEDPGDGRASVVERRAELLAALALPRVPGELVVTEALERHVAPAEHVARVERVRDEIAAGEVYQANLSHRLSAAVTGDPVELYLALRAVHPGPYAGYLRAPEFALLSGSPELLLAYDPETGTARTRPIKGTSARGDTPLEDVASVRRLLASEKDRAELAMIVDLERNDLGRVAQPGGVSVGTFPDHETHATVHHLACDVDARIAPEHDGLDVLAALFPGGSISGAPKLRSMELLAELEGEGRGYAYGSMIAADTRGAVFANILIRTLLWRPRPDRGAGAGDVTYRVGGGITWSSDAAAEEEETLVKGRALARILAGEGAPVA